MQRHPTTSQSWGSAASSLLCGYSSDYRPSAILAACKTALTRSRFAAIRHRLSNRRRLEAYELEDDHSVCEEAIRRSNVVAHLPVRVVLKSRRYADHRGGLYFSVCAVERAATGKPLPDSVCGVFLAHFFSRLSYSVHHPGGNSDQLVTGHFSQRAAKSL
jgi:hypothetical protein